MARLFRCITTAAFLTILCGLGVLLDRATFAAEPTAGKLVIVKAEFGDIDADKTIDVTAKVSVLVKDNSLFVEVRTANLGNPLGNGPKKLKVGYTIDGVYRSKTAEVGQQLDISTRLTIRKAVYGNLPNGRTVDVTEQIIDLVQKNGLKVEATNDRFGDPANGVVKKLRVDYTLDGVEKSQTVEENQTLTITAPARTKS